MQEMTFEKYKRKKGFQKSINGRQDFRKVSTQEMTLEKYKRTKKDFRGV